MNRKNMCSVKFVFGMLLRKKVGIVRNRNVTMNVGSKNTVDRKQSEKSTNIEISTFSTKILTQVE